MGRSDPHVLSFYNKTIKPRGTTALLGFSNNNFYNGDLYDLSLDNWNINSEWMLDKKYDTIICTRCAYFAEDPWDFVERCYENLNKNGVLYVDWGQKPRSIQTFLKKRRKIWLRQCPESNSKRSS